MDTNQTTASGEELTLITGMGGATATRRSIEKLYETRQLNRDAQRPAVKRTA